MCKYIKTSTGFNFVGWDREKEIEDHYFSK